MSHLSEHEISSVEGILALLERGNALRFVSYASFFRKGLLRWLMTHTPMHGIYVHMCEAVRY